MVGEGEGGWRAVRDAVRALIEERASVSVCLHGENKRSTETLTPGFAKMSRAAIARTGRNFRPVS